MAQRRRHVPKFGNFESDKDVEYTAYFEKARQDKGTGGMKTNPNDPKESPDNFMYVKKGKARTNDSFPPISVNDTSLDMPVLVEKQSRNHRGNNNSNNNSRSIASASSYDKNNKDNFSRGKNTRKKSVVESDYYVPPLAGTRSPSYVSDTSYGSAATVSVPKFGEWDEKDPTSGEGFTVLFNKVKEEKQISASKFPAVPPPVVTHTKAYNEKKKIKPQSKKNCTKNWCCLCPSE